MTLGEYPVFSDAEKGEIRDALADRWGRLHAEKNETPDRWRRDQLTERLLILEGINEKVRNL